MYYEIDTKSFFYKLSHKYNKFILTGPSGSIDMLYKIFSLFKIFNLNHFIIANVGYICYYYHHSIFEVLLPAISYGIDYDITKDEYKFIEDITTNQSGGKTRKRNQKNRKKSKKIEKNREKLSFVFM